MTNKLPDYIEVVFFGTHFADSYHLMALNVIMVISVWTLELFVIYYTHICDTGYLCVLLNFSLPLIGPEYVYFWHQQKMFLLGNDFISLRKITSISKITS